MRDDTQLHTGLGATDAIDASDLLALGDGGPLAAGAHRLLTHRFEHFARISPQRTALVRGDEELSYAELDARSNRLARRLRDTGVGPEVVVGVCLPRQTIAVVAILAVLKAGGAYLWLEPDHPFERRRFMLEDAGAEVLITFPTLSSGFDDLGLEVLTDLDLSAGNDAPPRCNPPALDDLAYIMYTSGSTGAPKGVMIEHRALSAFVEWGGDTFGPEELSGVMLGTSLGFDASIFELFVPLGCGGCIVLVDNLLAIGNAPADRIRTVNSVPSLMTALLNQHGLPPSVATVVMVGELLSPELAERIHAQPGVRRLVNAYGPTEDTCFSTWTDVAPDEEPTIGRPFPGTQAYVLDDESRLLPPGELGELHLGGAGLARGYRRREELTLQKFIPNPLPGAPSPLLYRTGDLAYWLPNGALQHAGRIDHQIKIRGVRIEPGEIESALLREDGIRQAVAVARERSDGHRTLIAYIVPDGPRSPDPRLLRERLRRTLTEPMIPSAFVVLDELPLNENGKLDRARLPEPSASLGAASGHTRTERDLANLWAEALGLDCPPGPDDDFFDLGGHSLVALSLFDLISERFGAELSPSVLLEASTPRALARLIDDGRSPAARLSRLHPEGARQPWIYIHPGSGGAFTMRAFSRAAGEDQPIFGLQAFPDRAVVGDKLPTVPEAASRCLDDLREIQPHGPYLLSGHSIGGHVAFDIACTLQAQGEEVDLVALLDPVAPDRMRWRGRLLARGRELAGIGPEERRPDLVRAATTAAARRARSKLLRRAALPGTLAHVDPDDQSWERLLIERERSWTPRRFSGDVLVFQTGPTVRFAGTRTLGWERYVKGSVDAIRVPGEHVSMLLAPHVDALAREMSRRVTAVSGA